ncbi:MAG: cadherin repeat domain-containing protein [Cellvibrionales bacterium]|nr:cadherin repeat domain-containing protein [Cellvibrionales bacterium]
MKSLIFSLFIVGSGLVFAAQQEAQRQLMSLVRAYEKPRGDFHALIQLWAGRTGGRNPDANDTPCEIWTKNKMVFNQALEALVNNHPVEVTYSGRGDKDSACQVAFLTVPITDPIVTNEVGDAVHLELVQSAEDDLMLEDGLDSKQGSLARFSDDSLLLVWAEGPDDGKTQRIMARHYTYKLYPQGDAFQISTATPLLDERMINPNVVILPNDDYVISWNYKQANSEGARFVIYNEFHTPNQPIADMPNVNTEDMQLVALDNGGFAMVGVVTETVTLYLFDGNGSLTHTEVLGSVTSHWAKPDITLTSEGHLAIIYGTEAFADNAQVLVSYDIATKTERFRQSFGGVGNQGWVERTQVTALDNGEVMALFATGMDIKLRRFSSTGDKLGAEVRVNEADYTLSDITLETLADGSVFVSWVDEDGNDGEGSAIFGRRFGADGIALTESMIINRRWEGYQSQPSMVQSKNGTLFVTWTSNHSDKESIQVVQVGVNQITTKPNSYTIVGRVIPNSRDDEDLSFSLIDDADGRFVIFSDGTIKVKDRNLIDYNTNQAHTIKVQISDGDTAVESDYRIQVLP